MSFQPLPRRTFLKGVGAVVALPALDAMFPASLKAATLVRQTAPVRMAYVFVPNGIIMPSWTPAEEGADYTLTPTLSPLDELKDDFLVISRLAQDNGFAKGDGPGDHARSAASFLTGAHPYKTAGADIKVGQSVDQVAAERVGKATRLPSLEVGIERGRQAGSCDSGYSCAYSSCISWKTASTPMAKEIDPRLVFERLFGNGQTSTKEAKQRDLLRQSILDLVADDANRLKNKLGQTDRRKVDEYFTSVRELEQRIERASQEAKAERPDFDLPDAMPRDLQKHVRLMFDLMALAFQTDSTRIATCMLANEGSNRSYPSINVTSGHHELSHHRNDEEKIAKIQRIDQFLVGEFAYFLEKLKNIPEGDGTLLDNSMICYGAGISDGNRHKHNDLPVLLAGKGGGSINTGRHLRLERETPMNNLFLSMLDRMGAPIDELGDSTGRLTELS